LGSYKPKSLKPGAISFANKRIPMDRTNYWGRDEYGWIWTGQSQPTMPRPDQRNGKGGNWDDKAWAESAREYHANKPTRPAPKPQAAPQPKPQPWQERIFTAADWQTMTFPPMKFVLPGIVPKA
jgi:hypothetical protein